MSKTRIPLVAITTFLFACGDDVSSTTPDEIAPSSTTAEISSFSSDKATSGSSTEVSYSSEKIVESSSNESASDWRYYCLEVINSYRATEDLKPLTLAPSEKQECTDKQSAEDLASGKAHGHFGDCGEFAQNSGPNISLSWAKNETEIVDKYLEMMWDEKKLVESGERDPKNDSDYPYIGHYLNMSNTSYSKVACGIAKSPDKKTAWFNIDFY